jgi:hypothetical protein
MPQKWRESASCVLVMLMIVPFAAGSSGHAIQADKAVVRLEVQTTPPDKRTYNLTTHAGEPADLELPNGKRFRFVPGVNSETKQVKVRILDASADPPKEISTVDLQVGKDAVKTKTTPVFLIRLVRLNM